MWYRGLNVLPVKFSPPAKKIKSDAKKHPGDCAADTFDETNDGACCPASGQQIIDDQNTMAGPDGGLVHFERVLAVFEIVRDRDFFGWQLFRFADRNKSGSELVRKRRRKDKSARFDAHNRIDLFAIDLCPESIDRNLEACRVKKERRDVVKIDARLWEIWHLANKLS